MSSHYKTSKKFKFCPLWIAINILSYFLIFGSISHNLSFNTYRRITTLHSNSISLNQSLFECFSPFHSIQYGWNLTNNTHLPHQCNIYLNDTNNISFIIFDILIKKLFRIKSLNSFDLKSEYLIKPNKYDCHTEPDQEFVPYREYQIMRYLSKLKHIKNNIIKVYDEYPLIEWEFHGRNSCIFFMEYIPNTTHLSNMNIVLNFITNFESFLLNCYNAINSVLDALWYFDINDKFIIHNDLYSGNMLLNLDTDSSSNCYLIDFERILSFKTISNKYIHLHTLKHYQSPFIWYYLRNATIFIKHNDDTINSTKTMLMKYGYKGQTYKLQCIFLDILTKHIMPNWIKNIYWMSNSYIFIDAAHRDYNELNTDIRNIWCFRIKQIILVIEYLNKSSNSLINMLTDLLNQIKHELNQTKVNCQLFNVNVSSFSIKVP